MQTGTHFRITAISDTKVKVERVESHEVGTIEVPVAAKAISYPCGGTPIHAFFYSHGYCHIYTDKGEWYYVDLRNGELLSGPNESPLHDEDNLLSLVVSEEDYGPGVYEGLVFKGKNKLI
jgi:hypothetical protein